MSCPRLDDHLRSDLQPQALADLAEHTLGCSACTKRRATLETTRQLLLTPMPSIDRQAAAQWLVDIEASGQPPVWRGWLIPALGAAAAAVLLFVVFNKTTSQTNSDVQTPVEVAQADAIPQGPMKLKTGQKIEQEGLRLLALTPVALTMPLDPKTQEILLGSGRLNVSIEGASKTAIIRTRAGRLSLEVGQYSISSDGAQTAVTAMAGRARLKRGTAIEDVVEGQSKTFAHTSDDAPAGAEAAGPDESAGEQPLSARRARRASARRSSVRQKLHEARALLGHDDKKAAALADDVLTQEPEGKDAAEALMIAADARRRDGRGEQAQRMYAQVAEHPDGAGLAEEAVLRRATLLVSLSRGGEALVTLQNTARRFERGGLAPERTALLAQLLLGRGHPADAARALLNEQTSKDRVLDAPRIEVAKALVHRDRATALRLVEALVQGAGPRQTEAAALHTRWSQTK